MAGCLLELAPEFPEIRIVGQVSRTAPATSARVAPYFDDIDTAQSEVSDGIDLVIDFSLPAGTLDAARWCAGRGVAMLSGVTGIGDDVHAALNDVGRSAPVLWAANLSLGVNLLAGVLRGIGRVVGESAAVTIEEVHHAGKKDAPSGTALFLARHLRPPAEGAAGTDPGRIATDFPGIDFISRREGEVVGDHSISVDLNDEVLTFSHHAKDRHLFARGALEAAMWLVRQPPGRYSAGDWIRSMAKDRPENAKP